MKAIIKFATAATLLLFVQVALAVPPTEITSCGFDTSGSGNYVVTQNLTVTTGDCIDINHANVTLDCQGYRLKGLGSYTGIHVGTNGDGSTVKNCDIYDFNYGIYLYQANNVIVEYNKVVGGYNGIRVYNSDLADIRWNKGSDNTWNLYLQGSDDNDIYENVWHRAGNYGVYCYTGDGNDFIDNQINHNSSVGMYFFSCDNGDIWYNTANMSGTGLNLQTGATGNDVYKNVFNRNSSRGIYDAEGSDTTNSYEGNVCKNNGVAPSWPSDLCK